MAWWGGRDTQTVRDRFLIRRAYEDMFRMQQELLKAAAKKASWWQALLSGINSQAKCFCAVNDMPRERHKVCYGTGVVGGYIKYGFKDVVGWVKDNVFYYSIVGTDEIKSAQITGGQAQITDLVIDAVDISDITEFQLISKDKAIVSVTVNGAELQLNQSIQLPVGSIPVIALTVSASVAYEGIRFRWRVLQHPWLLVAEHPPLKMEQLFRWGIDTVPFDVRGWTITDAGIFKTDDLIEWHEGMYKGVKLLVVSNKVSQFPLSMEETSQLSQLLALRKVKSSEQAWQVV